MRSASVDAVVQSLRLHHPPSLWRAVRYALAVVVVSALLLPVWDGFCKRYVPRTRYVDLPGVSALRATHPTTVLAIAHSRMTATQHSPPTKNPHALEDLAGHWDVDGFIAIDAASEELSFRGVPFVVARWLDVAPFGAVLFGTLRWVGRHHVRELPKTRLAGRLDARLWLRGGWYLAIGIHVVHNWLGHCRGRVGWWLETGRYPQRPDTDASPER